MTQTYRLRRLILGTIVAITAFACTLPGAIAQVRYDGGHNSGYRQHNGYINSDGGFHHGRPMHRERVWVESRPNNWRFHHRSRATLSIRTAVQNTAGTNMYNGREFYLNLDTGIRIAL